WGECDDSLAQQKFLRVEHTPEHVFERGPTILRTVEHGERLLQFAFAGRPAQRGEVELLDDAGVWYAGVEESPETILRFGELAVEQFAGDQPERLRQGRVVGALAVAAQGALRLAEEGEEAQALGQCLAAFLEAHARQLPGPQAGTLARKVRRRLGHLRDRVEQLLRLQR